MIWRHPSRYALVVAGDGTNGSEAAWRALADSVLAGRLQFGHTAGITYEGVRDLYTALGYKRRLIASDYLDRYRRGGVAARVVDAYPGATWRGGAEMIEVEDEKRETDFEKAWLELDQRLKIWSTLLRADILAGLGRFSVVFIGAPGDPASPLPKRLSADDIAYLSPLGEFNITVDKTDNNPKSPRWGSPIAYRLTNMGQAAANVRSVHYTRVIHIAENCLTTEHYGRPRLEPVWNYLDDLDKIIGGGAESYWLRAHPGIQLDVDPTLRMSADDETALSEEVDEYLHGYRRALRTRGVTLHQLAMSTAPIGPNVAAVVGLIAAATGIPQRILMGSERGSLASEQDRSNWQERVQDRRTSFAEVAVVRPLVDLLIERKVLPEPEQYSLRWPEVRDLSLSERAQVGVRLATVNQRFGRVVVTPNEVRDRVLGLPADANDTTKVGDPIVAGPAFATAQPPKPAGAQPDDNAQPDNAQPMPQPDDAPPRPRRFVNRER